MYMKRSSRTAYLAPLSKGTVYMWVLAKNYVMPEARARRLLELDAG